MVQFVCVGFLFCFVRGFGGLICTARCKNNLHSNEFHCVLSGTLLVFPQYVFTLSLCLFVLTGM